VIAPRYCETRVASISRAARLALALVDMEDSVRRRFCCAPDRDGQRIWGSTHPLTWRDGAGRTRIGANRIRFRGGRTTAGRPPRARRTSGHDKKSTGDRSPVPSPCFGAGRSRPTARRPASLAVLRLQLFSISAEWCRHSAACRAHEFRPQYPLPRCFVLRGHSHTSS
jgi:hypothetical protein